MDELTVNCILGIDPGGTWTGWAAIRRTDQGYRTESVGTSRTITFMETQLPVWLSAEPPDVVVIEEFRNYPGHGGAAWSTNDTSQQIGQIRMLLADRRIPFYLQKAALKKPAAGLMRARGIAVVRPPEGDGPSGHAADAQRHAWYWAFQRGVGAAGLGPVIQIPSLSST
jgi:Holliday junction resolvasome RuvABC endonuclease subunit